MNAITLELLDSAQGLLDVAGGWLYRDEMSHQFLLSVLDRLAKRQEPAKGYFAVLRDAHGLCGVVAESPTNLVISSIPDPGIEVLATDLDRRFAALPEVFGPSPIARALATAVGAKRDQVPVEKMRSTFYVLSELRPPQPPIAGEMRLVMQQDIERAVAWLDAFLFEASPVLLNTHAMAERLIAERGLFFWRTQFDVALGGVSGRSARGARLGWIYTPPEFRGCGYGSALTAEISRRQLDSGMGFCCLYADLANPVSNRIYRRLGYREHSQSAEVGLGP